MRKVFPYLIPFAVFIGLAIIFAYLLTRTPMPAASRMLGQPLPAFSIETLGNTEQLINREFLTGEPAIINVFASWCLPCLAEHPMLLALSQQTEVPLYGINWNDPKEKAAAWLEKHGNPYADVGWDPKGVAAVALGITGAPETFIIDRQGYIRYHFKGPLTPDIIKEDILPLLERLQ